MFDNNTHPSHRVEDSSLAPGQSQFSFRPDNGIDPDTGEPIRNQSSTWATPVAYPSVINIGRPAHDTSEGFASTWTITVPGVNISDIGTAPIYLDSLVDGSGNPVVFAPNTIYTITVTISETDFLPAAPTPQSPPFPTAIIESTSTATFIFGELPTDLPTTNFPIDKTLTLPLNMAAPTTGSFTFTANLIAETFHNTPSDQLPNVTLTATLPISTMTPNADNDRLLEGTAYLDFSSVPWPRPGRYVFRVTENQNTSGITDMEYDDSAFYLHVYVGWVDDTFSQLIVLGSDATPPAPHIFAWPADTETLGSAQGKTYVEFANSITPPPGTGDFEVQKLVTGNLGNAHTFFGFSVELELPDLPTHHTPTEIAVTVTGYQRSGQNFLSPFTRETLRTFNIPIVDGVATTVGITPPLQLRHGDIITFANVPFGTDYTVTESWAEGYLQTAFVTTGGIRNETEVDNATAATGLVVSGTVEAETNESTTQRLNYVLVTNDHDTGMPTGVFLNNMPFIIMVVFGVGALGLAGFVVKRKRAV